MQLLLVALLACLSVAAASPVGMVAITNNIVNTANQKSVVIDVTSDFLDIMKNQHIFQVAVGVNVQSGEMYLNGQRVARGVQTTVQFAAQFRELAYGTNQLISAKNVQVAVQAVVQVQITDGVMSAMSVQMLLSEVDGNALTKVYVQEVVVFLNAQGAESGRTTRPVPVDQSLISTTTTSTTTSSSTTSSSNSDSTPDSDSDSNSDSPVEGSDVNHDEHKKCRVRQFFHWLHKQSFGVRLLVIAIITLIVLLTLKVLFCCVLACCCSKPKSRTTYLDNVKLHYVPLSMDDDELLTKKKVQLI